ncbi:MAG: hypothetical protein LBJ95_03630 [Oscillospiraceae bacterium]|jgi:ABC-type transport system involved in multi-copper enzyme maturation permease subunit|nr:hypothetical protein [Oscillospiraceae bacterium]
MFNLIKSDFYKLWNDRKFWVFSLLTVAFVILMIISTEKMEIFNHGSQSLLSLALLRGVIIFASIFITIFIINEFSCGLLSMNVARGAPRIQIYFSKLIASICSFFVLSILNIVTSLICVRIAVKEFLLPDNFLLGLSFQVFISLCWVCVVVAIAFFLKSKVWTITIVLLAIAFGNPGIHLILNSLVKSMFNLTNVDLRHYWLLHYGKQTIFDSGKDLVKKTLDTFFYGNVKYYVIIGMVVSICYAIPASIISILKLKQCDLK